MAKIPQYDLTLQAVDYELVKYELLKRKKGQRTYLGMSLIGEECHRKLFYYYRKAAEKEITPEFIRNVDDGFAQEDVMARRLRLVPGIKLITHTQEKKQIRFDALSGHFVGHCDGIIEGLKESDAKHIWEHKSSQEKDYNKLLKLRNDEGEKKALYEWNEIYHAQAQMYMNRSGISKHFLTVSMPGGRHYCSIRTDYKAKFAEALIKKAKGIIFDNWVAPTKISEKREFYKCKWCDYQEICHDGIFPDVNCRTCRYSEPVNNGEFKCHKKDKILKKFDPCNKHVYNPALIDATLTEHVENGCIYNYNGIIWVNYDNTGFPDNENIKTFFTSDELKNTVKSIDKIKDFL